MKTNSLIIEIRAPIETVFHFCLNPANTPKWIPSVLEEHVSETPVRIGTVFYQHVLGKDSVPKKNTIVVTSLIENKQLNFHAVKGTYACYYRFESIPLGTRLTYTEEAGLKEKFEPLPESCLQTLKRLIESKQK